MNSQSLPLIAAGPHQSCLTRNILRKPVSHSRRAGRSALIYSLYQAAHLLLYWLNKTPGYMSITVSVEAGV